MPSLHEAGLRRAHQVPGSNAWRVSIDLPALCAPGDGIAFHATVESTTKKACQMKACQICLAFLLVVAPRKIVFHTNSLSEG